MPKLGFSPWGAAVPMVHCEGLSRRTGQGQLEIQGLSQEVHFSLLFGQASPLGLEPKAVRSVSVI